jgi:hypothetical protein
MVPSTRQGYPSVNQITAEMMCCWEDRANKFNHPILKTRYANLVWEFSRKVPDKRVDIKYAHMVIDGNIAMTSTSTTISTLTGAFTASPTP